MQCTILNFLRKYFYLHDCWSKCKCCSRIWGMLGSSMGRVGWPLIPTTLVLKEAPMTRSSKSKFRFDRIFCQALRHTTTLSDHQSVTISTACCVEFPLKLCLTFGPKIGDRSRLRASFIIIRLKPQLSMIGEFKSANFWLADDCQLPICQWLLIGKL